MPVIMNKRITYAKNYTCINFLAKKVCMERDKMVNILRAGDKYYKQANYKLQSCNYFKKARHREL